MEKVVYLLGAGSTQSEINFQGKDSKTTMSEISKGVLKMSRRGSGLFYKLSQNKDFPLIKDQDIEKLMSLFQGYDDELADYKKVYEEIRKLFRDYLIKQITKKKIKPHILNSLLYAYKNYDRYIGENGEKLMAVLTTNYDTLLDYSFDKVFDSINLGFSFTSEKYKLKEDIPLLLKLHGSFNWEIKDYELCVHDDTTLRNIKVGNKGWLPPSVYKKPQLDLYKAIWSKAKKALIECDVLRVIGCSLRNEDISLLSLIFTSQLSKFRNTKNNKTFNIEFIDFEDSIVGNEKKEGVLQRLPFLANASPFDSILYYDKDMDDGHNPFNSWVKMLVKNISLRNNSIYEDEFIIENLKLD